MNRLPVLVRWLALAALADWLIGRTLTRSAIFMPKSPPVIAAYQGLNTVAALAATLTALLAYGALGWIIWQEWRARRSVVLPAALAGLAAFSLAFLLVAPSGWPAVAVHLLTLLAVGMLAGRAVRAGGAGRESLAILVPTLAIGCATLYQLLPAVWQAARWAGPPPLTGALFNAGELLVVLSAAALWWAHGRPASRTAWFVAALPALAFSAVHLAAPAMSGILSMWSIGLSLYLPWPLYTLAIWLAGVTVYTSLRRRSGDAAGWAILLLAAGGYAPQLSAQAFLGLAALWLLGPQAVAFKSESGRMEWISSNVWSG